MCEKRALLLMLLIIVFAYANSQSTQTKAVRQKMNFNRAWKFTLGDPFNAQTISYDDRKWEVVGIPHSFSIPYFMSLEFYTGYGWYRKEFDVDASFRNKKVFLEFEAVFQQAEIFVNGTKAGNHQGGYTGFSIDITDAIKPGKNVVAVRVNNIWKPDLAPRAGEHVFSGGIYRDVYLVKKDPVHVAWYGSFITTPVVSNDTATVKIETEIKNTTSVNANVKIVTTLFEPKGKQIATVLTLKNLQPGKVVTIEQKSPVIKKTKLWHPDHPYLYKAVTAVFQNGKKTDEVENMFGIRSLKWTADSGFFLNGKHLYLLGANVHQDHAGWGDAVTNAGFYRDVQMIKDAGFNMIRGSHYPHDPAFAEACDKIGLLYISESNFWGIGGSDKTPEGYWNSSAYPSQMKDTAAFHASIIAQLKEMIRINRNHPSIIAWSVSNEAFFSVKEMIVPMRNLLKKMVAVARSEDPTRAVMVGGAQRPLDSLRIDNIGDIAGYNGDGASIPLFQNPGFPTLVSEYGSVTSDRPGSYSPGWGDLTKDNGLPVHNWRSGQAIWCAFDHGSIAGASLGKMGIVDYFRIPKRSWYWYRNGYKNIPPPEWPKVGKAFALQLKADRKTAGTDGTGDVMLNVTVVDEKGKPISNCPDVTLTIVSGPGEFPTGSSITFSEKSDIRILDGQAAIEYRSWYSGKSIVRATSSGLKPAEVEVVFTGNYPFKAGITSKPVERPYKRYSKSTGVDVASNNDKRVQVFGRNNPTFSSSNAESSAAGFAADGDRTTFWQAAKDDERPSFILDTEKKLELKQVILWFNSPAVYQFKIETSNDQQRWELLADYGNNQSEITDHKLLNLNDKFGRFIRISFYKSDLFKVNISEIEVSGIVL